MLSIISNSEDVTVVRYKGDLMIICNLYLAEIESLHLKKNDLALKRLEKIQQIKESSGPDSIGVLCSARTSNEDNYVAQKFARAVIGTNNVDHCARL